MYSVGSGETPAQYFERTFEFRSDAFREYMAHPHYADTDAAHLMQLSADMASPPNHPIVQYAGGWAMAEAARNPDFNGTMSDRYRRLKVAATIWSQAADGLAVLEENSTRSQHIVQARKLNVEARRACAYLQLQKLALSWLFDDPLSPSEAQHSMAVGWKSTIRMLNRKFPQLGSKANKHIAGMVAENLCGLIGQIDLPRRHIVTPASLRQDCNVTPELRADFIATSWERPGQEVLIQVKSDERLTPSLTRAEFTASRDFVLASGKSIYATAAALRQLSDGTASPDTIATFDVLGRVMTNRLDAAQEYHPVKVASTA